MHVPVADPNHPNLRVRNALSQFVASLEFIGINGELSALDVDGSELAHVVGVELGPDLFEVNGVAAPGELVFAVPRSRGSHILTPSLQVAIRRMPRHYTGRAYRQKKCHRS